MKKSKQKIICTIIAASATIIAALITKGISGNINSMEKLQGYVDIINRDYVFNVIQTSINEAIATSEKVNNNNMENVNGDNYFINGDYAPNISVTEVQINEEAIQEDERERPYTVRETYPSCRAGEPGKEYKLVCIDTRMAGNFAITYYTYDVTYY